MATKDQVRYLDPDQFRKLDQNMQKVNVNLERIAVALERAVVVFDEITQAGEESDGSAGQGTPPVPTDPTS